MSSPSPTPVISAVVDFVPAKVEVPTTKRRLEQQDTEPKKCRVESSTAGRYVCSLLVIEIHDGDPNLISHKTYVTNSEADAVRHALGEFVSKRMITYKHYQDSFKKYKSLLVKYQKECEESKVDSDVKKWEKVISKKRIFISSSVSHLLLLDENGRVDVNKCDEDRFLERLYGVNTVKSFEALIKDILPILPEDEYSHTVTYFQCLDTQQDENDNMLPYAISEKAKDVDSFKAKIVSETDVPANNSDSDSDSNDNDNDL
jgi:hypothetical protein